MRVKKSKKEWAKTIMLGACYGLVSYMIWIGGNVIEKSLVNCLSGIKTIKVNPGNDEKTNDMFNRHSVCYWALPKNAIIKNVIVSYEEEKED